MIKILDSCYIKDQIIKKNYWTFLNSYIMDFQTSELTKNQLLTYSIAGGKILLKYQNTGFKRR